MPSGGIGATCLHTISQLSSLHSCDFARIGRVEHRIISIGRHNYSYIKLEVVRGAEAEVGC